MEKPPSSAVALGRPGRGGPRHPCPRGSIFCAASSSRRSTRASRSAAPNHPAPPASSSSTSTRATFDYLRNHHLHARWPFPRRYDARVIDRAPPRGGQGDRASTSSSPSQATVVDDNALIEAIGRAGNVVLSTTEVLPGGRTAVLGGDAVLRQVGRSRRRHQTLPPTATAPCAPCSTRSRGCRRFAVAVAEADTGRPVSAGPLRRPDPPGPDRLRRPARHLPRDLLLAGAERPLPARPVRRQDRACRRLGADAAGRPPDADVGGADGRHRSARQPDDDGPRRDPATRPLGRDDHPADRRCWPCSSHSPDCGCGTLGRGPGRASARSSLWSVAAQLAFDSGTQLDYVDPALAAARSPRVGTALVALRAERREHRRAARALRRRLDRGGRGGAAPVGPAPPWQPTAIIAGYRIEGVVGRGGMGVVYRATQLALERPVAIKLIAAERAQDPVFRSRFERESRLAASIEHPQRDPRLRGGRGRRAALHRHAPRRGDGPGAGVGARRGARPGAGRSPGRPACGRARRRARARAWCIAT